MWVDGGLCHVLKLFNDGFEFLGFLCPSKLAVLALVHLLDSVSKL